jgi:hypothetical protein
MTWEDDGGSFATRQTGAADRVDADAACPARSGENRGLREERRAEPALCRGL